jgi:hypothetical protein
MLSRAMVMLPRDAFPRADTSSLGPHARVIVLIPQVSTDVSFFFSFIFFFFSFYFILFLFSFLFLFL